MTLRVLVVGPVSANEIIHLAALPAPTSGTHFAERTWSTLGGTSAGKALNLAVLGAEVTLLTVLGTDEVGARVRSSLAAAGVTVVARPSRSGHCERHVNLMTDAGERISIYTHLPEPADPWRQPDADEHLAAADAVVVDLCDHSRPWIDWGRRAGVPVWADLHDYDGTSAFHDDFLRANHLQVSSVRLPDWRGWAAGVATSGRSVVVTHGSRGSSALDGDGVWTDIAGEVLDVVDTNGAGDAFFAGFLLERSAGSDVTRSLRAGARQAAVCLGGPHLAGTVGELVG